MGMPLPVPRFTIDMLDQFPDDGTRYELLEGFVLVTPAPSYAHQVVATRIVHALMSTLGPDGPARVVAVGAIQQGERTQLQPDILVCPAEFPPTADWRDMHGWWLAVEVLSPSSRVYDREVKRGAYLMLGVEEYWLVDPVQCSVEVWTRDRLESRIVMHRLAWRPAALDREIMVDLDTIFRDLCSPDSDEP